MLLYGVKACGFSLKSIFRSQIKPVEGGERRRRSAC
jgi:hypothetical protein